MDTPADNSRLTGPGARLRPEGPKPARPRAAAARSHARVLGALTIPGRPEHVGSARAFVGRTLGSSQVGADADAATLLTSEVVTNAIQHTKSSAEGGTVTIVVIGISHGVLVEIIDNGSAGTPMVRGDLYAAEGHGLFLVQHLAPQWGYLRDSTSTTVWFHLPASGEPHQAAQQPGPDAAWNPDPPGRPGKQRPGPGPHRTPSNAPTSPTPPTPGRIWARCAGGTDPMGAPTYPR